MHNYYSKVWKDKRSDIASLEKEENRVAKNGWVAEWDSTLYVRSVGLLCQTMVGLCCGEVLWVLWFCESGSSAPSCG